MKRVLFAAIVLLCASPVFAQGLGRNPLTGGSFYRPIQTTVTQTPWGYGYSSSYYGPNSRTTLYQGPQIMPYGGGYSPYGYQPYGYGYFGGPGFYGSTTTYGGWGW